MTDVTQRALEREYRRLRALERIEQGLPRPKRASEEPLDLEEMARLQRKWYAKADPPPLAPSSPPPQYPIAVFGELTLWPDRIALTPGWYPREFKGAGRAERPLTGVRATLIPGVKPRLFEFGTPQATLPDCQRAWVRMALQAGLLLGRRRAQIRGEGECNRIRSGQPVSNHHGP